MAMVARSVFMGGRRAAFATTLGIGAGCLVWALASAAGVTAVLAASETAYDTLRLVGAAYLIFLGGQSLWAAAHSDGKPPPIDLGARGANGGSLRRPFRAYASLWGSVLARGSYRHPGQDTVDEAFRSPLSSPAHPEAANRAVRTTTS